MPRAYDRTRRAAEAARTTDRIVDAAEAMLPTVPLREVTLPAIAAAADVTVQTVLRHLGSRQGVLDAVAARVRGRVEAQRGGVSPGDVEGALDALLRHYEAEGRLVLGLLAQERDDPMAAAGVAEGRAYHRAWVARCLGVDPTDEARLDALVAATDLYVWKLLRLDLGRPPDVVRAVVGRLARAILEGP